MIQIPDGEEREKETEEIFETIMTENFPKTTDPGTSENIKLEKYQKNLHLDVSISNYKDKENILKEARANAVGKNGMARFAQHRVTTNIHLRVWCSSTLVAFVLFM